MIQRDDSGSQANFGKHRLRVTSKSDVPDWIDVTQGKRGRENEREREREKQKRSNFNFPRVEDRKFSESEETIRKRRSTA